MRNVTALGVASVFALSGAFWASDAAALVPNVLVEQGRLLDGSGVPQTGAVPIVFTIYDSPAGNNVLWTEMQTLTLDGGYFSAQLGDVTPLAPTVFNGSERYLGIAVNGDAELSPRQTLDSVPYAFTANNAVGDITPTSITIKGTTVIDGNGNWVGPASGMVGPTGPAGAPGATGATGATGADGATGANGLPGARGADGATGPTGAPGPAGAIGATGSTGAQGPAGAVGATGSTGAQGTVGATGAAGANGATGPQGAAGPVGATGSAGAQGPAGAVGPQGPAGAVGPQGPIGPAGAAGPTGPQGPAGAVGAAGPTGAQGPAGAVGATGAAGAAGATGAVGATGSAGAQGPAGAVGAQGPAGAVGPLGPIGPAGAVGPTGPQGAAGAVGAAGPQGLVGATGPQGVVGATGPAGPGNTVTAVTTSLACTNPCSLNVVTTCPAGTRLTGCFATPSAFCNSSGNGSQDLDVMQALSVISPNTCVVDYMHNSTFCGAFSLSLAVTTECLSIP